MTEGLNELFKTQLQKLIEILEGHEALFLVEKSKYKAKEYLDSLFNRIVVETGSPDTSSFVPYACMWVDSSER